MGTPPVGASTSVNRNVAPDPPRAVKLAQATPEPEGERAAPSGPDPVVAQRDPTPARLTLQRPSIVRTESAKLRTEGSPAAAPGTLDALSRQFGARLDRLPVADIARLKTAYTRLTDPATARQATGPFLQTMATALVHDRQRLVGELVARPGDGLVGLAPAIQQQAGLMRAAHAGDYLAQNGSTGYHTMQRAMMYNAQTYRAAANFTRDSLNDPAKWAEFQKLYQQAVGGEDRVRWLNAIADRPRHPDYPNSAGRFISAMNLLSRPGADGQALLQRATPQEISQAATARIVELGRDHPALQTIPPARTLQIADALAVPGTEQTLTFARGPQGGLVQQLRFSSNGTAVDLAQQPADSPALAEYRRQVQGRLEVPSIQTVPRTDDIFTQRPLEPLASARTLFEREVQSTASGLAEAGRRLSIGTMDTADLLPLAYQTQEHLVGEMRERLEAGQPVTGVLAAARAVNAEVTKAEEVANIRRNIRTGTAVVGAVAGVGLMLSGPLGWGAAATTGLAVTAGTAAVSTMALDAGDFIRQRRAGGLDQAGLVMSNLDRENWAGMIANMGLNAAGAVGGLPAVRSAISAEQATERLRYAQGLVSAMENEPGAARVAALTRFLNNPAIARASQLGDFSALSAERQAAAMRIMERFGPEVDAPTLGAMLRFGARDADIAAGMGPAAAGNVDHMFAAYSEMNVIEAAARGRPLTERERMLNAIATIGTDAQGKFGHGTLEIVPTLLPNGQIVRTPPEFLQAVRERAVSDIFAGADAAGMPQATRQALATMRNRFMTEVAAETDGGKRMAALGRLNADAGNNPEVAAWLARRMSGPDLNMRFMPFTEGAYVHNVVDPRRIYQMGVSAGMSETDAAEAAYRATMHGFGNAFVSSAYPGMPQFASLRLPNGRPLFTPQQLEHLDRVGRASLAYNQEARPTAVQARAWGIAENPPPVGVRQVFTAAMRANNGTLPPGLQEWLVQEGAAFRAARLRAGIGAGATDSDNLGNYVPDGMRKWAGIFAANPGTPKNAVAVGDQTARLLMGMNAYAVEEASVGNIARFSANFAGPAARIGMYRPEGSAAFRWIMRRGDNGGYSVATVVRNDTTPAALVEAHEQAVRSAAAAVRHSNSALTGSDAEVLAAFYNQPEANARAALATLAEGELPPAFNVGAFNWTQPDRRLSPFTQLLLYQQTYGQAVRARNSW